MSNSTSFWDHPVEKIEEGLAIRKQIAALQAKLKSIFGGNEEVPKVKGEVKGGKRTMSPAARARIAAAQRARWAKSKAAASPVVAVPAAAKARKPVKKAKRNISPEAREKMAAAARKRWAGAKAKAT